MFELSRMELGRYKKDLRGIEGGELRVIIGTLVLSYNKSPFSLRGSKWVN